VRREMEAAGAVEDPAPAVTARLVGKSEEELSIPSLSALGISNGTTATVCVGGDRKCI
jgi:hypothetical protein